METEETPQESAINNKSERPGKGGIIPPKEHRFGPRNNANPGGRPKGVSITAAYNKLLKMKPEQIKAYKPKTGAEVKALQVFASVHPTLIKESWDRTDGKVADKTEHTGKDGGPIVIEDKRESILRKLADGSARISAAGTPVEANQ